MSSLLLRIDDRLLHGQVLVGWGNHLGIRRFVVANDAIASSDWEREMIELASPEGVQATVLSLLETVPMIKEFLDHPKRSMVLVSGPEDVARMYELGLTPMPVNVGGMHFEEGRRELLPYLFISPAEERILRTLEETGFEIRCQDLPTEKSHRLQDLL